MECTCKECFGDRTAHAHVGQSALAFSVLGQLPSIQCMHHKDRYLSFHCRDDAFVNQSTQWQGSTHSVPSELHNAIPLLLTTFGFASPPPSLFLQPAPLPSLLHSQHISLAQDRAKPLLLHLCLALPATATSVSLEVQFSKAFLTVFEQPPDAYRGFDVPAAIISYLDGEEVVKEQQQQQQQGLQQDQQQGLQQDQQQEQGLRQQQEQGLRQQQEQGLRQQQQQEQQQQEAQVQSGPDQQPSRGVEGSGTGDRIRPEGTCCGGVNWEVQVAEGHQRRTALLAVTPLLRELAEPKVPQVSSAKKIVNKKRSLPVCLCTAARPKRATIASGVGWGV